MVTGGENTRPLSIALDFKVLNKYSYIVDNMIHKKNYVVTYKVVSMDLKLTQHIGDSD